MCVVRASDDPEFVSAVLQNRIHTHTEHMAACSLYTITCTQLIGTKALM